MIEFINSQLEPLMRAAREDYGVDPIIFITIYLVSVPIFYYSLARMLRALAKRLEREIMLWSMIFLGTVVAPFVYVLFFGRNLPWWAYVVIALIVGQGVFSLVRTLRRKPAPPGPEGAQPEK